MITFEDLLIEALERKQKRKNAAGQLYDIIRLGDLAKKPEKQTTSDAGFDALKEKLKKQGLLIEN